MSNLLLKKKWTDEVHHTWQLDGKESVRLQNKKKVSWMNIADEASGAHLKAFVHDCKTVAAMDPQSATRQLNICFENWGLPKCIKVDNGYPYVYPQQMDLPTKAKLWWIGLGIEVIQNTPGRPQENGIVEGLQGTMCKWSNPIKQPNEKALQNRLDEESDFQRNHYRLPSKGRKTRKELFPELEQNSRIFNPDNFSIQRVYEWMSYQVWDRTVNASGEIKMYHTAIYVGTKYKEDKVTVTFDPVEKKWIVRHLDGTYLKNSDKAIPTEKGIKDFAL